MTTVLIVDDHERFRATARRVLERAGFDVVGEAGLGTEAVTATLELQPDAVLLDVQLPDMSGFEVVRLLAGGLRPPVVVLTSSRDESDYGTAVAQSDAAGFIPKHELSGPTFARMSGVVDPAVDGGA